MNKDTWADNHHLKESNRDARLEALIEHKNYRSKPRIEDVKSWCDHSSLWNFYGNPVVFVTQPYHLDADELFDIAAFVKTHDLDLSISGGGWHTEDMLRVEIWAKGMFSKTYEAGKKARAFELEQSNKAAKAAKAAELDRVFSSLVSKTHRN